MTEIVETVLPQAARIEKPTAAPSPAAESAPPAEVRRGALADLGEIVRDLVFYRDLLFQLTLRDIRIRYKQAVMGFGWALFMPIVIVLAGLVVRIAMAQVSGGEIETASLAGVAVKSLPWAFFVGAINFATPALTGNMNLVTKIYFPREVLPLSAVLAQTVDSTIGTVVLFMIIPFIGVAPDWAWAWVPLLALLLFVFTAASGLFLSCANLFFRDVKYIVQVVLMFGIFFTPIFFEPAMFGELGSRIILLNPLSPIVEGLRLSVVEGHNLLDPVLHTKGADSFLVWSPWYLVYSAVVAIVGLLGSALLFHRSEFVFAEYI